MSQILKFRPKQRIRHFVEFCFTLITRSISEKREADVRAAGRLSQPPSTFLNQRRSYGQRGQSSLDYVTQATYRLGLRHLSMPRNRSGNYFAVGRYHAGSITSELFLRAVAFCRSARLLLHKLLPSELNQLIQENY